MLDLVPANLPKNVNGFRTTHTCELCGFEPKTKNKYREKQDHLVMKHFKEKIDKIFPHSRPYACPTAECGFQGKDKQALLRHYTGKHGILEKYLKEALAEKGISYVPGEHGSKRKHSDANGMPKLKKMMLTTNNGHHHTNGNNTNGTTTILDPKDLLPKSPVPLLSTTIAQNTTNGVHHRRPNTQELRNEVEAMMASLDPIPHQENVVTNGSSIVKVLPSLPSTPVPVSVATMEVNGVEKKTVILSNKTVQLQQQQNNQQQHTTTILHQNSHGQIVQAQQQQQQVQVHHQPATSVVSLVKRNDNTFMVANGHNNKQPTLILANGTKVQIASAVNTNGGQIHIPELILPEGVSTENGGNIHAIPIEVITTTVASTNGHHTPQNGVVTNGDTCVVENEEVMWGAASNLLNGPAVVVEAVEPVTYIEEGGTQIVYSASMDNIDYDYLYPVTTTTATTNSSITEAAVRQSAVRERQLEFNML